MKELIEAYIGTGAEVTGYNGEMTGSDLCYVVEIYNATGHSIVYISNAELLSFM